MPPAKVKTDSTLVLGAGELGAAVLRALSKQRAARQHLELTVLLRPLRDGRATILRKKRAGALRELGVRIIRADLAERTEIELASIFERFSTIVCCTGYVGGRGTQRKITAAVLRASVERYIPWQFGVDYDAVGRGSGQEVWDEQLDVREMLRAQSRTHWTIITTGMFTSFLFKPSFGLIDLEKSRVHALGRWENEITVTASDDIGRLTAAILASVPRVDGVVFVAGDTLSYQQLADTVEYVIERPVDRVLWSVADLERDLALHPDDEIRKYRLAFARGSGVAWNKEQSFNGQRDIAVVDVARWLREWVGKS